MNSISITNARSKLYDLVEEVSSGNRIIITKKGESKAILISPEELASWEATLEVMADTKLMREIKVGLDDLKAGRIVSWKEVKEKAGL